ncbi:hypothetical protein D3C74_500180 [compost metagenome]
MWSRPIRMARVKSSRRDAQGASARSSQTVEACVIVTSLSTPMPARTIPQIAMPCRSIAGA